MPSNEARRDLLSNERLDTCWDALWLELWPFLYFIVESRRIACRCLQTKRGAICCRMNRSRASGTLCGSSYGRFCFLLQNLIESHADAFKRRPTQFAIEWRSRKLLGRLVARVMAIFVFWLICSSFLLLFYYILCKMLYFWREGIGIRRHLGIPGEFLTFQEKFWNSG